VTWLPAAIETSYCRSRMSHGDCEHYLGSTPKPDSTVRFLTIPGCIWPLGENPPGSVMVRAKAIIVTDRVIRFSW
jgi:hypothetical protein